MKQINQFYISYIYTYIHGTLNEMKGSEVKWSNPQIEYGKIGNNIKSTKIVSTCPTIKNHSLAEMHFNSIFKIRGSKSRLVG